MSEMVEIVMVRHPKGWKQRYEIVGHRIDGHVELRWSVSCSHCGLLAFWASIDADDQWLIRRAGADCVTVPVVIRRPDAIGPSVYVSARWYIGKFTPARIGAL